MDTLEEPDPRPLDARDLPQGDIGACIWDATRNDDLLTVSKGGMTVHWGPREARYRGIHYPPDVVTNTESIQAGLPTFPDGRTGVVTLELELPRVEAGLARFRIQGQDSRQMFLPSGAVVVPAACLLKEGQRVTLAPIRAA
jgi:hypothetical protein